MGGSTLLELLRELGILDGSLTEANALVALGRTLGRAAARRELGDEPHDEAPAASAKAAAAAVTSRIETAATGLETFPFASEHPSALSARAKKMLEVRDERAWADVLAPGTGLGAVRFPQFCEVYARLAIARYQPKVPKYLEEAQDRQLQLHLDWIRQQADFGRHRRELMEVGAAHDESLGFDPTRSRDNGEGLDDGLEPLSSSTSDATPT